MAQMSDDDVRHGKVRDGSGKYAPKAHSEAGDGLDALGSAPEVGSIPVVIKANYVVNEIPPRCRVPRPVERNVELELSVRAVTSDDAPVAFDIDETLGDWDVREFDGRLYRRMKKGDVYSQAGSDPIRVDDEEFFGYAMRTDDGWCGSAESDEAFEASQRERLDRFLVVDDEVWEATGEPRYVVQTFGLGHNHGGTALFVTTDDNHNIRADRYFRADDFEAARDCAVEVARGRGDTDSADAIESMTPPITVNNPEAVTLVVPGVESHATKQAREEFRSAAVGLSDAITHARTNEEVDTAFERLVEARSVLGVFTDDTAGVEANRRPYEDR